MPDPDGFYDGPLPAKETTLEDVHAETGARTIHYIYDFGDDWDHVIRVERIDEASPGTTYPRLLKATGACPPEDLGGARGYEEFLEALADPGHEQHDDMIRWAGGAFDPNDAKADRIVEGLARLAKKWAPRPRKTRSPDFPEGSGLRRRGPRRMLTIFHDTEHYKKRHRIENSFARLKDWRRVAIRYDRCPKVFLSACALAAIVKF